MSTLDQIPGTGNDSVFERSRDKCPNKLRTNAPTSFGLMQHQNASVSASHESIPLAGATTGTVPSSSSPSNVPSHHMGVGQSDALIRRLPKRDGVLSTNLCLDIAWLRAKNFRRTKTRCLPR